MTFQETAVTRRLQNVKHVILVLAGKGGVGKSSVSTQLALNLYNSSPNAKVGILDVDLTGPSIPRMFGVDDKGVHQSTDGWVLLACMSVGFLLKNKGDSVVWRGPKKNGMIRQFLSDVRWGELNYWDFRRTLSLMEHLAGIHSRVALMDAMKCLSFTRAVNLPVLGLIENMSGYVCPCCGEISNVFSTGGGSEMARKEELRFLGTLPVDIELVSVLDVVHEDEGSSGFPLLRRYNKTPSAKLFQEIAKGVLESLNDRDS
ncbi:cytosolic Fe-S cluster assembling factor CFD1 [Flammula alnicola]|nr:cytosolic Fe-S cluster assembling factor CFD1 [Flammula alnicola]